MHFDLSNILPFTLSCSLPPPIVSSLFFLFLGSFMRAADRTMGKKAIHGTTVAGPLQKVG